MASAVRDLELDLDAFEGPFDLLLTLLLKDAIQPSEIDMAGIIVAFVERLAGRDELDLDACGEFLVLIASLLEPPPEHDEGRGHAARGHHGQDHEVGQLQ